METVKTEQAEGAKDILECGWKNWNGERGIKGISGLCGRQAVGRPVCEEAEKRREECEMTLLMRDRENQKIGEEIGKEIGRISGAVSMGKDLGLSDEEIVTRLRAKFGLTEEQARQYLEEAE